MAGDHEDSMREFQRNFAAAAVDENGVQVIVAADIESLAKLLANGNSDVNESTLQEVLTSKKWEATQSFTWEDMCLLKDTLGCLKSSDQGEARDVSPLSASQKHAKLVEEAGPTDLEDSDDAEIVKSVEKTVAIDMVTDDVEPSTIKSALDPPVEDRTAVSILSSSQASTAASCNTVESLNARFATFAPVPIDFKATPSQAAERSQVVVFPMGQKITDRVIVNGMCSVCIGFVFLVLCSFYLFGVV